jgi:dephospho-CoA kinase
MLIGITGTDGAGKGSVVDYLVKTKGFTHYSSREFIMEHMTTLGLEPPRNNMRITANKLRAEFGNDFVIRQAFARAEKDGVTNAVIESVRALAEAEFLKANTGILLAVDAGAVIRYERVQGRRSASDKVTFEEFLAHEELEKNDPDPNGMQKAKVMEMADFTIMNNGSFKDLQAKVDSALQAVI